MKSEIISVEVDYWSPKNVSVTTETGFRYLDTSSHVTKTETWTGTKEEIFKKFDKLNNRLRYCNGSYWKFKLSLFHSMYRDWYKSLDEPTKMNMFYGNGVVD